MPDQARFLDFMDMIDGGGKGRMGDKFEGGGIFSALANLVATPYGSEDAGRKAKREAAYRAAGLLAPEEAKAEAAPIAAPAVRRTKPTRAELMSARAAEMERQRGLQQDVFDPRDQQGATSFRVPVAPEYRSMDQAVGGAQYPSMYRSMDSVVGGMGAPSVAPAAAMRQPAGTPTAPYEQTGAVTDVRFGPPAMPSPMLDQRQQAPAPNEARALQAIADNNMMDQFMNLQPYQQRAMIETMLQRGY